MYIYEASDVLKSNLGISLRGFVKVVLLFVICKVGEVEWRCGIDIEDLCSLPQLKDDPGALTILHSHRSREGLHPKGVM